MDVLLDLLDSLDHSSVEFVVLLPHLLDDCQESLVLTSQLQLVNVQNVHRHQLLDWLLDLLDLLRGRVARSVIHHLAIQCVLLLVKSIYLPFVVLYVLVYCLRWDWQNLLRDVLHPSPVDHLVHCPLSLTDVLVDRCLFNCLEFLLVPYLVLLPVLLSD